MQKGEETVDGKSIIIVRVNKLSSFHFNLKFIFPSPYDYLLVELVYEDLLDVNFAQLLPNNIYRSRKYGDAKHCCR